MVASTSFSEAGLVKAKHLLCPLCVSDNADNQPSLLQLSSDQRSLICQRNHTFDIAKQGYVNLLPVQQKKSSNPGDSKEMVVARKAFLGLGYYQPLVDALILASKQNLKENNRAPVILDAGCGEGYYTDNLQKMLIKSYDELIVYGFDIAKPAVLEMAKKNKFICSFVSTVKAIPILPHSCDLITSVFSPMQPGQFHQLLKADGKLLILSAGKNHLHQLKSLLYTEITDYNEDKFLTQLESYFTLSERTPVQHTMTMKSNDDIQSLLAMTPHFWRASPEAKKQLDNVHQLSVDIDVQLMVFTPKTIILEE